MRSNPIGPWGDEIGGLAADLLELLTARPAWHAQAACRGEHPGVTWFPAAGAHMAAAKAVCAGCPVRDECRTGALRQEAGLAGIWGGLSERDRRRLRSATTSRRVAS